MNEKRVRRVIAIAEKLKANPRLSDAERLVYAVFLEGTPDERWMNNVRYCEYVRSYETKPKRMSTSRKGPRAKVKAKGPQTG